MEFAALRHGKCHDPLRLLWECNGLALFDLCRLICQILLHTRQIFCQGPRLLRADRIDIKLYLAKKHPLIMQDVKEIILPLLSGIRHNHIKIRVRILQSAAPASRYDHILDSHIQTVILGDLQDTLSDSILDGCRTHTVKCLGIKLLFRLCSKLCHDLLR